MLKRVYAVGTLATVLSALWMLAAPRFAAARAKRGKRRISPTDARTESAPNALPGAARGRVRPRFALGRG